jgi:hypothetical protein
MRTIRTTLVLVAVLLGGVALAFQWEPLEFEERAQAYTIEILNAQGELQLTMEIDVVEAGDGFDVTTVQTVRSAGVAGGDLADAAFGGGLGMFGFGGAMFLGPAFMVLPLVLADEEVAVRPDPIELPGFGMVYMESTSEVAGATCVDVRIELAAGEQLPIELGLAEGVPFPCYSRYGEGDDAVEIRLTRIE